MPTGRCGLVILDGAGLADPGEGNVVDRAFMPFLFDLFDRFGLAKLDASGAAVGLSEGFAGNSEVGHLTIGLGRAEDAAIVRINDAFNSGTWRDHETWRTVMTGHSVDRPLHIIGLLSDAGVHGHWNTLWQTAELAVSQGEDQIVIHLVLDGVDSTPGTGPELFRDLSDMLERRIPGARIGVVIGRRWFADRSGNVDLTDVVVAALRGADDLPRFTQDKLAEWCRTGNEQDFPAHSASTACALEAGDRIIVTSHRADRAVQIVERLSRGASVFTLVTISPEIPASHVFYPSQEVSGGLAEVLAQHGIEIVRIAERCKFPHVTYFFNGFRDSLGETQICLPDTEGGPAQCPEMRAADTASACQRVMQSAEARAFVVNIPNLDQVGHCADIALAQKAAAATDQALQTIVLTARNAGWSLIVTADHGNAEALIDSEGRLSGSHTTNLVPLTVVLPDETRADYSLNNGTLQNIAPTFAQLVGVNPRALGAAKSVIAGACQP